MGQESRIENGFQSSRIGSTYGKDRLSEPPLVVGEENEGPILPYAIWLISVERDPFIVLIQRTTSHHISPIQSSRAKEAKAILAVPMKEERATLKGLTPAPPHIHQVPKTVISTYTSKTAIPKRSQTIKGTGKADDWNLSFLSISFQPVSRQPSSREEQVRNHMTFKPCFLHWSRQVKGAYPIHVIGNPHEQKTHSQRSQSQVVGNRLRRSRPRMHYHVSA